MEEHRLEAAGAMMARFDQNVPHPRLPLLRPQQQLLLAVLLAGMAGQTDGATGCHDQKHPYEYRCLPSGWTEYGCCSPCVSTYDGLGNYRLGKANGICPVPAMNAAFAGKLTGCTSEEGEVSRVCVCARCVRCTVVHQV